MSSGEPPKSLEEERQLRNPDGSVRDKSLFEIKREMLLAEAASEKEGRRQKRKREKKKKKKKRKKTSKHKGKKKKDRRKHKRKRSSSSGSSGSSDDSSSSSSSSSSDSSSDSEDEAEAPKGASAPLRYSEMMKGSLRTADGSDERVEVRYSSVSGKVISMDRKQSEEDKKEEEYRRMKLASMNGGEEDAAAELNSKKKQKKQKKSKQSSKGQMERVTESLVENGKRAREELQTGDYSKRLRHYKNASNEGLTVDFAQMQKDKRYYHRLKAAEKISKKAERFQSTEDAKMNALREQFGLDRLTAAADGRNLPAAAATAAPTMTSPQPAGHAALDIKERLLAAARERSKA